MRKYLLHVLIISFVFLLAPTAQVVSYAGAIEDAKEEVRKNPDDADDSLDTMLDMVMEKENQAKRLEELRRKREEEEQKRLAEIERLKNEQARKRIEAIIEDIRKYERIVSSEYGRDMKEAAWNNLVSRYPEASGLAVGDINGFKLKLYPKIVLRSSYKTLSLSEVQSMPNVSIRKTEEWGICGHSTINHDYNLKAIKGDKVVVDNATGLMWHQGGSGNYLNLKNAKEWVWQLNSEGYAGYHDWRLPTLEEAASLLESNKRNDLYIDPIFSNKQEWIWSGDEYGSEGAWLVCLSHGFVDWYDVSSYGSCVRPVRSVE